ncbi:MAG: hypothetical protein JSU74_08720 [Candidatus Zixiibacteriota bacterium]|nr:MAG: hypothetical protein JSU74_08720 [candidate division Zixibacteria bacterium]
MEISQQFLIDMALNIGGYLLAGGLGIVIYSFFNRRRKVAVSRENNQPSPDGSSSKPAATGSDEEGHRLEFIKLGEKPNRGPVESDRVPAAKAEEVARRRDRAETIRVARTMLKAGAPHEKIKRLIPISDAELSLLSMSES